MTWVNQIYYYLNILKYDIILNFFSQIKFKEWEKKRMRKKNKLKKGDIVENKKEKKVA
jgi:hypothetical protein